MTERSADRPGAGPRPAGGRQDAAGEPDAAAAGRGGVRGSRREAILDAAAAIIAERSLPGLSMTAVAKRAGVAPALLYYHFGSREDLVRGALHYANDRGPSINLLTVRDGQNGFEAVRAALAAEFDDDPAVRNLSVIWNEVEAMAVFEPAMREDLGQVTATWNHAVAIGVLRGIADGSIRQDIDPVTVADILTTLVEGLSQQWLARSITAEQARETLSDALTRMLARPAPS